MGGCVELSSPAFFGEILVGKQITATQLLMPHSYDLLLGTNAKNDRQTPLHWLMQVRAFGGYASADDVEKEAFNFLDDLDEAGIRVQTVSVREEPQLQVVMLLFCH